MHGEGPALLEPFARDLRLSVEREMGEELHVGPFRQRRSARAVVRLGQLEASLRLIGLERQPAPVILNWVSLADEPLKVIRLPSDRFDPSRLLPDAPSAIDALRNLLETILEASGATPLPDADGARGRPFAPFASLALYHDQVLMVGRTES